MIYKSTTADGRPSVIHRGKEWGGKEIGNKNTERSKIWISYNSSEIQKEKRLSTCLLVYPSLISVSEETWLRLEYLVRNKGTNEVYNLALLGFFSLIFKRIHKGIIIKLESKQFIGTCKVT